MKRIYENEIWLLDFKNKVFKIKPQKKSITFAEAYEALLDAWNETEKQGYFEEKKIELG